MRKISHLFPFAVCLLQAASFAQGCGGQVVVVGTCQSVCSDVLACFDPDRPSPGPIYMCARPCEEQQQACGAAGDSSAFQALLNCVANLPCGIPKQVAIGFSPEVDLWVHAQESSPWQAGCASVVSQVNAECPYQQ
jgi:hypothetical protein